MSENKNPLGVRCVRKYKSSVAEWEDRKLQEILVPSESVKKQSEVVREYLQKEFLLWNRYRSIILNLPTGAGKTTFVLACMVKYAIENNSYVLIVSNRIALDVSIKKKITNMHGLYKGVPDDFLRYMDDYGVIKITTYQGLPKYLSNEKWCKSVGYAIFDEAHYFTTDATFSKTTDQLLKKIPIAFSNAIRIYMSATIDEALPYISQAECNESAIHNWCMRYYCNNQYYEWYNKCNDYYFKINNPRIIQWLNDDVYYAPDMPTPIIYKMKPDYSHIRLLFYKGDDLYEIIYKSKYKNIVFVDNKNRGSDLNSKLGDSDYMNSDLNKKDPKLMNYIIDKESFPKKTLITTSVFCNGCNICDKSVKNIFIESIDKTDILQMTGRRRKISDDDTVTLYLKIPTIDTLEMYRYRIAEKIDSINEARTNNDKYVNKVLDGDFKAQEIANIVYQYDKNLYFNPIAIDMLYAKFGYYSELINLLQDEGEEGYCKMIAKTLFNKDFSEDMIVVLHNYYEETIKWLENYKSKMLNEKDFEDFSSKLLEKIKLFNKSAKERGDRKLGINALNNRLAGNNLPYHIIKNNGCYTVTAKTVCDAEISQ